MDDSLSREPMLEMYIFESNQLLEQLEEILLLSEKADSISSENINEIFRIMHTIKGSSAMMMFNNISSIAHAVEDLFYFIREKSPENISYSAVCDIVLAASDFIKGETGKIEAGREADGSEKELSGRIKEFLSVMKGNDEEALREETNQPRFYISSYGRQDIPLQKYTAKVRFEDGCRMENIRAYTLVHSLKDICAQIYFEPKNILEDNSSSDYIIQNGFVIFFATAEKEESIHKIFSESIFVSTYELQAVDQFPEGIDQGEAQETGARPESLNGTADSGPKGAARQGLISVNVNKLDKLMDLVGEIVITESMVTRNPDLAGMQLESFGKAARQLRKLTDELQDIVMSIRMIPIAAGIFGL